MKSSRLYEICFHHGADPVIERLLPHRTAGGDPGKKRRFLITNDTGRSAGRFAAAVCRNGNIPTQSWNQLPASNQPELVAMRSAKDNAAELIQDLTLMYNKAPAGTITTELPISAAAQPPYPVSNGV